MGLLALRDDDGVSVLHWAVWHSAAVLVAVCNYVFIIIIIKDNSDEPDKFLISVL